MTKTRLGRGASAEACAALAVLACVAPRAGATPASVSTAGAAIAVNSFRGGIEDSFVWVSRRESKVTRGTYCTNPTTRDSPVLARPQHADLTRPNCCSFAA